MSDEPVRILEPPHAAGIMLVPQVRPYDRPAEGWMVFAAMVMLVSALLNGVWGFFAILHDYYWTGDTLLAGSHALWGWLYIAIAAGQLILVPLIIVRHPVGVFFGIVAAALNAVFHVLGFGHRPAWSIVALVIDAVVIYALVAHGYAPRRRRLRAS